MTEHLKQAYFYQYFLNRNDNLIIKKNLIIFSGFFLSFKGGIIYLSLFLNFLRMILILSTFLIKEKSYIYYFLNLEKSSIFILGVF